MACTHDHRAWFRLWLPLGETTPSRDTYLRPVRQLDPESAVKAALWLLDGASLTGLEEPVLALGGKVARPARAFAAGLRPLHMGSAFLVREGLTLAQEPCDAKCNEITDMPRLLDCRHCFNLVDADSDPLDRLSVPHRVRYRQVLGCSAQHARRRRWPRPKINETETVPQQKLKSCPFAPRATLLGAARCPDYAPFRLHTTSQ